MFSLGSLTTLDEFETVSVSDSEIDTVSDGPTDIRAVSEGPEPTETSAEVELESQSLDGDQAELEKLGFEEDLTGEPLLPAKNSHESQQASGQAPHYKNLFWRKYLASQQPFGRLTTERLMKHNEAMDRMPLHPFREPSRPVSLGEWVAGMKDVAKRVPVKVLTTGLLGDDIGIDVADFVGGDALNTASEGNQTTMEAADIPDGFRVVGSRCTWLALPQDAGRSGFMLDEVSISSATASIDRGSDDGSEGSESDTASQAGFASM